MHDLNLDIKNVFEKFSMTFVLLIMVDSLYFVIFTFVMYEDSIANLDEAVSAVNFSLSGEIQNVDAGLTALGDTVAELEGRMENVESELASIEEVINELDIRLTKMEVTGILIPVYDEYIRLEYVSFYPR